MLVPPIHVSRTTAPRRQARTASALARLPVQLLLLLSSSPSPFSLSSGTESVSASANWPPQQPTRSQISPLVQRTSSPVRIRTRKNTTIYLESRSRIQSGYTAARRTPPSILIPSPRVTLSLRPRATMLALANPLSRTPSPTTTPFRAPRRARNRMSSPSLLSRPGLFHFVLARRQTEQPPDPFVRNARRISTSTWNTRTSQTTTCVPTATMRNRRALVSATRT